jgi:MYXO-CTERM domain-containing protein
VRRATLVVACAATLAASTPAAAYVRYTLSNGAMFKWPQSCVMLTAFPADFEERMPLDQIMSAVTGSADAWSKVDEPCTYLNISVDYSTAAMPRATPDDRKNMVVFRTMTWCKLLPSGECDPLLPYDPAALALTTVSARMSNGQIVDADIEVNSVYFLWGDLVGAPPASSQVHDLRNAMTHEMGHLIGLDHTCFPPGNTMRRPVDDMGNPIVDCDEASQDIIATTMFPSADSGDVEKRTLAPDDQRAVCEIYPADSDPNICMPEEPDDGGCNCSAAAGGRPSAAAPLAVTLAVAALVFWRRRRGRAAG